MWFFELGLVRRVKPAIRFSEKPSTTDVQFRLKSGEVVRQGFGRLLFRSASATASVPARCNRGSL
jgi:hypothetical protein